MVTLPIAFSAIKTTVTEYELLLTNDQSFAALLSGADRQAIVAALAHLSKLLNSAIDIEPNGYRPALDKEQLETTSTILLTASMFVASIQTIEFGANVDMERLVGGLLAMARQFPALEHEIGLILAGRTLSQPAKQATTLKPTRRPNR